MKMVMTTAVAAVGMILAFTSGANAWNAFVIDPNTKKPIVFNQSRTTVGTMQVRRSVPRIKPQIVEWSGRERPGTIIVSTEERRLYLVKDGGKALQYAVGVGRPGFQWRGSHRLSRKAEWPDWRPPAAMLKRQPDLPTFMPGGPQNPLGARALYIGSTLYRIHGSNEPYTIGQAVSSGCIRMHNEDVVDLYERVRVGARIIVR